MMALPPQEPPSPPWFQEICHRLESQDGTLQNLNLNIRRVNHTMMKELAQAMVRSKYLLILNLTSSVTDDPGALHPLITQALQESILKILHLNYNRIQDEIAWKLGKFCLMPDTNLTELYLDYNYISAQGAKAMAQGLVTNKTLLVLQLNYNNIQDEGACAIAQALAVNRTLVEVGMRSNGISSVGCAALWYPLAKTGNCNLKHLHLEGNLLTQKERELIGLYCCANRSGRGLVSQYKNMALFPHILARISSNRNNDIASHYFRKSLFYLFLRKQLYD